MSNQSRMSTVLLEESEHIEELATLIVDADGRRSEPELYLLTIVSDHTRRNLVHDISDAIAEAVDGPNGVLGVRAQRLIKEAERDLRPWSEEPDPSGPANVRAA